MARYLPAAVPDGMAYVGIIMRDPGWNVPLQAINGDRLGCDYRISWIWRVRTSN